jgi:predicted nucleic acid-binding protein
MRSLLLDANVLVLLIVGSVDRQSIESHKRCKQFTEADFELLITTVAPFEQLAVTTSVLTEASNLLAHTHEDLKRRLLAALGRFVGHATEERPESVAVVAEPTYVRLGLTDAALIACVRSGHSLLTSDLDLYLAASAISERVENFNHLRQRHLLS